MDIKDIGSELGKLAQNVQADDVKSAIDTVKKGAEKIDNEKVKNIVSKINVSDSDIKNALDSVKKL